MDAETKIKLKNEIAVLKGILPGAVSTLPALQQTTFPVSGPMVTIPSFPMAAQAIKSQNDLLGKIITVLEKVIDES